jgi:actin-related protein
MDTQTIHMLMYGLLTIITVVIVYTFIKNFKEIKETLKDIKNHFSRLKVKTQEQEFLAHKSELEKTGVDAKIVKAEQFLAQIDETISNKEAEMEKKIEEAQKPIQPKKEDIPPDIVILKPENFNLDEDIPKPKVMVSTKPVSKDANPLWLAVPVIIVGIFGWVYYQLRNKN